MVPHDKTACSIIGILGEPPRAECFHRVLGLAVHNHFTDSFARTGTETHPGPAVSRCDYQMGKTGHRTDDRQIVFTDGSKALKAVIFSNVIRFSNPTNSV